MKNLKKLNDLLYELQDGAKELMNFGNSTEKRWGQGMIETVISVKNIFDTILNDSVDEIMFLYLYNYGHKFFLESLTDTKEQKDLILSELSDYKKKFTKLSDLISKHGLTVYQKELNALNLDYRNNIIRIINH